MPTLAAPIFSSNKSHPPCERFGETLPGAGEGETGRLTSVGVEMVELNSLLMRAWVSVEEELSEEERVRWGASAKGWRGFSSRSSEATGVLGEGGRSISLSVRRKGSCSSTAACARGEIHRDEVGVSGALAPLS